MPSIPSNPGPVLLLGLALIPMGIYGTPGPVPARGSSVRVGGGAEAAPMVWVEREAQLMGTRLGIRIQAPDRRVGLRATEQAFAAVREAESLLSTWRPDSELSRLNRAPVGRATKLSPDLAPLLKEVFGWSGKTGGAFDPTAGAIVDAWDLRGEGRVPSGDDRNRATEATGRRGFRLVQGSRVAIRTHSAARIDAGGFGKGYALRAARRALEESGVERGVLDFGGQIETLGRPEAGTVAVADPSSRRRPALTLRVEDGSVSTSGGSERFVVLNGRKVSHVVDPRTGGAVPPWGSVTVVADDPMMADMLSTALFVMGPDQGMRWAQGRSDVAALFLISRGWHPGDDPGTQGAAWSDAPSDIPSGMPSDRPPGSPSSGERSLERGIEARWTPAMEEFLMGPLSPVRTVGADDRSRRASGARDEAIHQP